jgi:hypothetical protein
LEAAPSIALILIRPPTKGVATHTGTALKRQTLKHAFSDYQILARRPCQPRMAGGCEAGDRAQGLGNAGYFRPR